MFTLFVVFTFLPLLTNAVLPFQHEQSIRVIGQLTCNGSALVGSQIILQEYDAFEPDDFLDVKVTGFGDISCLFKFTCF
jgi:hypothetical protein